MSNILAPTAQPPVNDGINPPLTTPAVVSVQVPLPSLSPPQQSEGGTSISPSPVVVVAAPPPAVAPPPPPTLSPVESQPPQLTPQLPLQPPLTAAPTTPVTEVVPPPLPPPVITAPPTPDTPVTVTQPPPLAPVMSPISRPVTAKPGPLEPSPRTSPTPIPAVRQAKPGPAATKLGPLEPTPHSPPQLTTPFPAVRQAKPGPAVTKPGPLEPGPHSPQQLTKPFPAVRQRKSGPIATKPGPLEPGPATPPVSMPADTKPRPPVAASAVLPTQPPMALPVPQTPRGGAWFPATSAAPPSELPVIPGTPAVVDTPFFGGGGGAASGGSSSSLSSSAPRGSVSEGGGSNALVVGLVVGGVLLLLVAAVCGIFLIFCRRKHKKFDQHVSEKLHASSFMGIEGKSSLPQYTKPNQYPPDHTTSAQPLSVAKAGPTSGVGTYHSSGTFTYDELAVATSGFSDKNLLGQGGFGHVYKGVLPNGKEVAVKQLKMGGDQGEREFRAEVDTISQVHHKHLVSLVGFCISGVERLLVYEFVGNNTLDFHLHGKHEAVMDWPTRVKIAIGSAKGLAYLHEDCSPSIIHRDIKAANILLDFNYEAKVSDFGLAKICSTTNPAVTHITTRVVGTFGYLAPEYASSGKVTDKSDVYSYGVVLLELITGHPPISNFGPATSGSLVNWARPLLAQAIADGNFDSLADSRLQNNYNVDEMLSMVSCAAACVRLSSWRRPRMSQVIRALEGNLSASELDSGIKPGHSSMNFPYESLDFDARNYIENVKRMALASRYSDNTSDYGLNPSESSTDSTQHII